MDGAGPSSNADASTSQKRVQPQRKKRGGIMGNEIDQTIIEAQKWRAEKPLLAPDHPIHLTTDSSYAETAIDLGRIVKNFKAEQYYTRPEVIELYRKQRNIATPEVVSLKDEPSLSRFRPREADKTIVSTAQSDEVYHKRHKALETHERRERLRELEMMKQDYFKLKERIKVLEKIEFTAFNTLPTESFSPLLVPVDLSSPYSEEAQIEGERRREEMLEAARSLDERYQFLLGDELKPQKKGTKATGRRPPTPAKANPPSEAMDVEVMEDAEEGDHRQDEEETAQTLPPPIKSKKGGRPRNHPFQAVDSAGALVPNAVASTSAKRQGRAFRSSVAPTAVGKGKKRAASSTPIQPAQRRTPTPPPPSPTASTSGVVSANMAESNGVSTIVSDVRTPMSPSPKPPAKPVLVDEDMEVEVVEDTEGADHRQDKEEPALPPPPPAPKPKNKGGRPRIRHVTPVDSAKFMAPNAVASTSARRLVRPPRLLVGTTSGSRGKKRAASPPPVQPVPKRTPTPSPPSPTASSNRATSDDVAESNGVPTIVSDLRTPMPPSPMSPRPPMVATFPAPTSHHYIIPQRQTSFATPPSALQSEQMPVLQEFVVEEEFDSRPKKRLRATEAPPDRQLTPPPRLPSPPPHAKRLVLSVAPASSRRRPRAPSLPPIASLSSAELAHQESSVPEGKLATKRARRATPELEPEPEPVLEAEPELVIETEPEPVLDFVQEPTPEESAPLTDVTPIPEPMVESASDSTDLLDELVPEPSPKPPSKLEPAASPEPFPELPEPVPEPAISEPRVQSEGPTISAPSPSVKLTEHTPSLYAPSPDLSSPSPEVLVRAITPSGRGRGRGRGRGGRGRGSRASTTGGRAASAGIPRGKSTRAVPDPTILQAASRNVGVGHRAQRRTHAFGAKLPSILLSPDEYDYELPDYIVGMEEFEPDGSPDEDESAESDKSRKSIPDLLHSIHSNVVSNLMTRDATPDVPTTLKSPSPLPRDPDSDNL